MAHIYRFFYISILICVTSLSSCVLADGNLLVKKSRNGICHNKMSQYYDKVKNYQAFYSLDLCVASGGRLPKNSSDGEKANRASGANYTKNEYKRSEFGNGWLDKDGDCLNERHEILLESSTSTVDRGGNYCTINRGRWIDPYSGKVFYKSSDVDIDHLVPLYWAWNYGANNWSKSQRIEFANDHINLFVVDKRLNREKTAKGVDEWLPPHATFQCEYVVRFERVMNKYKLQFISGDEKNRFGSVKKMVCNK